MRALAIVATLALTGVSVPQPEPVQEHRTAQELRAFVESVRKVGPDAQRGMAVRNYTLSRGPGEIVLQDGAVAPLDVGGRVIGAVFEGVGVIRFAPEGPVEVGQLERHLEMSRVDEAFERALFLFSDDTWAELEAASAGPTQSPGDGFVGDALDFVFNNDGNVLDQDIMSSWVNAARPALFHAHVDLKDGPDVYYRLDRGSAEEVSFGRDGRGTNYDVINSFAAPVNAAVATTGAGGGGGVTYRAAEVVGYEIDVTFPENLDFSATAELFAFINAGPGDWVPFSLTARLGLQSVTWDGNPTAFLRERETSQLWVRVPDSASPGAPARLGFSYAGDLVDRFRDWYVLRATTEWYPTAGETDATFDVRFKTHAKYQLMSGGDLTSTEREGDWVTTRWVVNEPAPHMSFNVGEFDERSFEDPRTPPVTLHYSERAHRDLGLITQADMGEAVGSDIVNSVAFLQEVFGPTSAKQFNVTEIPYLHGQAFPGMVQLSFVTFQWTGEDGAAEIFRAHEMAHQWWGMGVTPRTYHDWWLSEGLAQFSGLWYMQRVLMSSGRYLNHLDSSRDRILERRGKAGPISLGPRLVTTESSEDYQIIIYEKGAWVMHMLRNLMRDYDAMSDDRFFAMLKDFFQTNRGRSVSTDDFKAAVERHSGIEMTWFFDQWIHGTEVPKYEWAVEGESLPNGEYQMRLRVEQSEVPDDFKMIVPVRLDFGDEGFAHVRVLVEGPETFMELPIMPREPDDVVFNDQQAVLAEVRKVGW